MWVCVGLWLIMLFAVARHFVVNLLTFSILFFLRVRSLSQRRGTLVVKSLSLYSKSTLKPDEPDFNEGL